LQVLHTLATPPRNSTLSALSLSGSDASKGDVDKRRGALATLTAQLARESARVQQLLMVRVSTVMVHMRLVFFSIRSIFWLYVQLCFCVPCVFICIHVPHERPLTDGR
jgi:hypothetical protein